MSRNVNPSRKDNSVKKLASFLILTLCFFSASVSAQILVEKDSPTVIRLNAIDFPVGSVKVYACGELLTEDTDYKVDYTLGKVTILNPDIMHGDVVRVEMEGKLLRNNVSTTSPAANKPQKDYSLWDWEQALK